VADLAIVCRKCGTDFVHPGNRVGPKPSRCARCRTKIPHGHERTTTCASCDTDFTHTDNPGRRYCDDCRAATRKRQNEAEKQRRARLRAEKLGREIVPQDSQASPSDRACVQCRKPLRDDQPDDALFCDSVCSNAYVRANAKRGRSARARREIRFPRQFDRGALALRSEEIVQEQMRAFRESRRARESQPGG
jgi:hypothetical protein